MKKLFTIIFLIIFNIATLSASGNGKISPKSRQNNPSYNKNTLQSVYGNVSVKKWANNKKSAFSFTFDDSFMSQYTYALPILDKYGFKATFFVIAGTVTDGAPQNWRYGYWWQFRDMAAEGHEIGAHTMTHPDLTKLNVGDINTPNTITYELYHSQQIIEQKIPGYKCISFAYPYCANNSTVENVASEFFNSARTCGSYSEPANIDGLNWYSVQSVSPRFDLPRNTASDDEDEFDTYTYNVQTQSINTGNWSVFFTHEVVPMSEIAAGGDTTMYYPVSTDWLNQLCQWVKEKSDSGLVWEATYGNVVRYIKERQSFNYNIVSSTNNQIEISTATGLDTSIYNYPLTVDITVPDSWKEVIVSQGDSSEEDSCFYNGSDYVVRAHIVPGKDNVVISSGSSNAVSGKVSYDNPEGTALPNVEVFLTSAEVTDSTVTDSTGQYTFTSLPPGSYDISLEYNYPLSGVNSTDAMLIAKYFLKQVDFDSLQAEAADVNNDGKINSTDALMVCKRFVHTINSFNLPDWIFSGPPVITISNSDVTQNFVGIEAGDVNESYISPSQGTTTLMSRIFAK